MSQVTNSQTIRPMSVAHGIPLGDEPGLGALTLPGYFREVTTRFADREVLVVHGDDGLITRMSYAELWESARDIARSLISRGVGKEARVGVLMTNSPEWIASFFGIGLAGGVAVALSTFSTADELAYMLRASGVSVLLFEARVFQKDFAQMLAGIEPAIGRCAPGQLMSPDYPFLRHLVKVGSGPGFGAIEAMDDFLQSGRAVPNALVDASAAAVQPADLGALFFSSGSTAKPKGILSSHRAIAIQSWRWRRIYDLGDDVRTWSANGFFWSGNFGTSICSTLSSGGSLILQRGFNAVEAIKLMETERVTLACAMPHQWAQIEASPDWPEADVGSLKYFDAALNLKTAQASITSDWREPKWCYGNTETFTLNTAFCAGTAADVAGDSHGEPLPGNVVKIVDPDTGETLPLGERGEVAVKGPTLMIGYLGTPLDDTLDDQGFFRTGDGGYLDERGRLFWQGRLNDIIKTGGANVSPSEVDSVIRHFAGVKLSQTVGVPHDTLGEMVVTCVVPDDVGIIDEGEVRDFLRSRLASYKIPKRVLTVAESDLSFTGSAKVKTHALRSLVSERLANEGQAYAKADELTGESTIGA